MSDINLTWQQARQNAITATDCIFLLKEFSKTLSSKLKDINTFDRTRFQLYMEKTLPLDKYIEYQEQYLQLYPAKAKTMQEGNDREEEIGSFATKDLGFILQPNGNNLVLLDKYKLGATPDYYIEEINEAFLKEMLANPSEYVEITGDTDIYNLGKGILECKLTGEFNEDKRLQYEFQVQQQLLCTGLQWACIAVGAKEEKAINSNIGKRHYHFIKANKKFHLAVIEAAETFWQWLKDIDSGNVDVPKWDRENAKDAILVNIARNDIEKLAEEYIEAQEAWKSWQYIQDALKARMQAILGKKTTDLEIEQSSGQKIKIKQIYTQDTFYTEKDKESEIKKAEERLEKAKNIELGSVRTQSKLYRFNVDLV
jgi:hypothetical protein